MSWFSGLTDMFSGGNNLPEQEQVTMYLDLTCEETGKPFSIGGFSLPAEHDPNAGHCSCVSCFSSHLDALNGLAAIEEAKKRRR